jgi:hypothetical protein
MDVIALIAVEVGVDIEVPAWQRLVDATAAIMRVWDDVRNTS